MSNQYFVSAFFTACCCFIRCYDTYASLHHGTNYRSVMQLNFVSLQSVTQSLRSEVLGVSRHLHFVIIHKTTNIHDDNNIIESVDSISRDGLDTPIYI